LKLRVLKGLLPEQVAEIFSTRKWTFWERRVTDQGVVLRVEAPVGGAESYIVELGPYAAEKANEIISLLRSKGLIEQEIRFAPE
jgi:hypothetical protein